MRIAYRVALILLPAVIFWGCQTEEVADLSEDVRTTDVMVRLAASSSQAEAEAAVRSLIVKAEMGETFPGSRYEFYNNGAECEGERRNWRYRAHTGGMPHPGG